MKNHLNKKEISVIKVDGDGNCLFKCIVQQLHINKNIRHLVNNFFSFKMSRSNLLDDESDKLRQLTVDWLENNLDHILPTGLTIKDDIEDIISEYEDINSVEEYLLEMRDLRYAGQLEIYALSNILKKNINVFTNSNNDFYSIGMGNIYNKATKDDIYLYHNLMDMYDENGHHYNLIYLKGKSMIISKKKYTELNERLSDKPITRNILKSIEM
jgi:hypothetical protein